LLGYFSIWPFFVEIGLLLAIAATPLLRGADVAPAPGGNRTGSLDGLRGFLALGVFFHHVAISQQYLRNGQWISPTSRFYNLLGGSGVALFFMITGYLFYGQLLRTKGRPHWKKLYTGRLFRILPLYWFMFALVLLGVGIDTGWHRQMGRLTILLQTARWSLGGLFKEAPINGSALAQQITASVTWTLQYEWLFYLSLFFLAFAVRRRWVGRTLPPLLLCAVLLEGVLAGKPQLEWMSVGLLLTGMSVAIIKTAKPDLRIQSTLGSVLVIALLIAAFLTARSIYTPLPVVFLGLAFLLICMGADIFGLLLTQPARRLGNISYGIYLLQGAVLTAASSIGKVRALDLTSPVDHWLVSLAEALTLIALATLAHRFIERPAIDLGRRLLAGEAPQVLDRLRPRRPQHIVTSLPSADAAD
jgi:peptidoglycan/LPS O-acetylase OafA/YrhL